MADWAKIKAEYIRGGISTRKLAEKHGVSYSTLRRHCEKEKWVVHERKSDANMTQRIVDACATQGAKKACKFDDAVEKLLDLTIHVIEHGTGDPKEIKALTSALKDLREIKGIKSDADLREQEARIAKLRREAERDEREDEQEEIVFRISGMNDKDLEGIVG